MSALINSKPSATVSKESAPEVLSYRQRLYDRETLMLPNEPWNPAARLAQVSDAPFRPSRAHRTREASRFILARPRARPHARQRARRVE